MLDPSSPYGQLQVRTFAYGLPHGTLVLTEPRQALCAVLCGAAGTTTTPGALDRALIEAAASAHPALGLAGLATELDFRLREQALGAFSFAAVLARAQQVEVCRAGALRVHRIERGVVVEVTRDHIARNEPLASLPPELSGRYGTVATRALGGNPATPAETTTWRGEPGYRIVICSEEYHHFAEPASYWPELAEVLDDGRSAPFPRELQEAGLIIDVRFD